MWRLSGVDHVDFRNHFFRRRPKDWRAPSWSWASWDGPINPSLVIYSARVPYDCDAHFLDIQVSPESRRSMERLKYGFMKVRGLCATVGLGQKGFAASWLTFEGTQMNEYGPCAILDQESELVQYDQNPSHAASLFESLQIGVWNEHHPSSRFHRDRNDTIYCLLLLRSPESSCHQKVGVTWLRTDSGIVRDNARIRWDLNEFTVE